LALLQQDDNEALPPPGAPVSPGRRRALALVRSVRATVMFADPRRRRAAYSAALAVGALASVYPLLSGNVFVVDVATDMLLWASLSVGLNAVLGWAGLLDIGYIAFFAIGGYSYAILAQRGIMSFWPSLVVGVAVSAVAGLIIGIPTLRLHSDYLAVMTLGFGEIVYIAAQNLQSLTGGNDGLYQYPAPKLGGLQIDTPIGYYCLALGLVFVACVVSFAVRRSRLGRAWVLMRDDELAATATGVGVWRFKLYAYLYGSVWACSPVPFSPPS
jgi:branched-chain amino acid transport system permease protein